jgi:hypothetical protein
MVDNIIVLILAGSFTTIFGLFMGEILNLKREQRKIDQKKQKRASLLKLEIQGLMDTLDSYHHLCHRPFFDENREAICLARRLEQKSILSLVLDEIQTIDEDIVLFDIITQNLLFELKWAISDLIKTSTYISINSSKIENIDDLEEDLKLNLDMHIILLQDDEKFMIKKCKDLISHLDVEFDLFDKEY